MPDPSWTSVHSVDLVEAYERNALGDLLGKRSAVYMWKLALRPPDVAATDPAALIESLDRILRMPYGRITQHRLSHFAAIPSLELCGNGLPKEKKAQLYSWVARRGSQRKWLRAFMESLGQHAPALYVGETGNLRSRTRAHMSAETDFGVAVRQDVALDWQFLDLHYMSLGSESDDDSSLRKALEYVAAVVTIGGFTTRPG